MRILVSVFIITLSCSCHVLGQPSPVFTYLNSEHGLQGHMVKVIEQDSYGFMWIGTADAGISKYDGYEFTNYRNSRSDSTSLDHNAVRAILEDSHKTLWIGTANGLNIYNRKSDKVSRIFTYASSKGQGINEVNFIFEDSRQRLWFGGNNLMTFNRSDSTFQTFKLAQNPTFPVRPVTSICEDKHGRIWVTTGFGLYHYEETRGYFTLIPLPKEIINPIVSITNNRDGRLWLGSYGSGLWLFDPVKNKFTDFYQGLEIIGDSNEFLGAIHKVYLDSYNNIWIATDGAGLGKLDPVNKQLIIYTAKAGRNGSISDNVLWDIFEDRDMNLWIGSFNYGLNIVKHSRNIIRRYATDPDDEKSISSNLILTVYQAEEGKYWIPTDGEGVDLLTFDQTGQIKEKKNFRHEESNPNSLINNKINSILQDRNGWIWTGHVGGGITRFHPDQGTFIRMEGQSNEEGFLAGNRVRTILQDNNGDFWIGTSIALYNYDDRTGDYTSYPCRVRGAFEDKNGTIWVWEDGLGLSWVDRQANALQRVFHGSVWKVVEDRNGFLWISTLNDGFYKFDPTSVAFEKIKIGNDPFDDDWPRGLVVDQEGYLWSGAVSGLYKIDPISGQAINYSALVEGLKYFNWPMSQTSDGYLFVRGQNGIIGFNPRQIQGHKLPPPVLFTGLQLFNKEVLIGEGSVLRSSLQETKQITLTYKQSVFTIEYASLSFKPDQTVYSYKLEGYDQEWRVAGNQRSATYTNLDANTYEFRVRAGNLNGEWNTKIATLNITILPPPWKTWWAYSLYTVVVASLLLGWRQNLVRRERLRNKLKLEHMALEKVMEMDQLKTRFFANLSHEFRTPLTLILGPLKQMEEGTFKGDSNSVIGTMVRNSKRLLNLINQLLDFSKLEAGAVKLQTTEDDLVKFSRTVFSAFESRAKNRRMKYVLLSDRESILVYFDRDKLEKILINLLSNAFKFTKEEGSVYLKLDSNVKDPLIDKGAGVVQIIVKDTGIGITKDRIPFVFDRFYQGDSSETRQQEGAGIGLAFARELIELHHGSITVESETDIGTTFRVRLPLGRAHLSDEEVVYRIGHEKFDITSIESLPVGLSGTIDQEHEKGDRPLVLIIEDNEDMRGYIWEILQDDYLLAEAINGKQGLAHAFDEIPDLIISDIMMPEMDGYELTRKLKSDHRTSHIPMVLLTARAGEEAKVEGLETGADDYITKPFSPLELKARVNNLIELRNKLKKQFSEQMILNPKGISLTSLDQRFLTNAIQIVEKHRSDTDYSVEDYAREVGLSRSQLHRKLKALTGHTATEFIRIYRLKFARTLLEHDYDNIAQIAYECGFKNPSYFTECFKKQFGVLPSEFARANSE